MKPEALEALVARSPLGVPAVPGFLFRVGSPRTPRPRSAPTACCAADRPRSPADDAPFAADRQVRRSVARRARARPEGPRRAAGLLGSPAVSAPTEHDPSTCTACRGTGELISGLGGEPHRVRCPWCEGTGRFDARA